MNNKINRFQTESFPLAALLLCEGYPIVSIDRTNPRRAVFIFETTDSLINIIDDYRKGLIKVNPKTYYYAQREIKELLYDAV